LLERVAHFFSLARAARPREEGIGIVAERGLKNPRGV
jgi:hypothetical protein